MAPGVRRHGLLQVGAFPVVDAGGCSVERRKPLLARRQPAHVESELLERLIECVDLRVRGFDARLANLREISRCNKPRQQADDDHHDQQLEECETATAGPALYKLVHGEHEFRSVAC
jgi:hypothetical protein